MPRHIIYRDECKTCVGLGTIVGGGPFGNDIPCRCTERPAMARSTEAVRSADNREDVGSNPTAPTIYAALSARQDECTVCNRWFDDYATAAKYAQNTEKESGCVLYVIAIEKGP